MKANKCSNCGGTLEQTEASRMQEYAGKWYLIEHLPALVCRQCGEAYYSMDTHDLVLELVNNPTESVRVLQVEVLNALPRKIISATD